MNKTYVNLAALVATGLCLSGMTAAPASAAVQSLRCVRVAAPAGAHIAARPCAIDPATVKLRTPRGTYPNPFKAAR